MKRNWKITEKITENKHGNNSRKYLRRIWETRQRSSSSFLLVSLNIFPQIPCIFSSIFSEFPHSSVAFYSCILIKLPSQKVRDSIECSAVYLSESGIRPTITFLSSMSERISYLGNPRKNYQNSSRKSERKSRNLRKLEM